MTASGQNRTPSAFPIYVCYWGLSGHNQFESRHPGSDAQRVVSENCQTLKFKNHGFETK